MTGIGVELRAASSPKQPTDSRALTSRIGLIPKRRISGVVQGLMAMLPANNAATSRPARNGVQPKPSWNCSGSRNGTAVRSAGRATPR